MKRETLVASLFVAFTFIPALASRFMASGSRDRVTQDGENRPQPFYLRFYADIVSFTVRFPWVAITATVNTSRCLQARATSMAYSWKMTGSL